MSAVEPATMARRTDCPVCGRALGLAPPRRGSGGIQVIPRHHVPWPYSGRCDNSGAEVRQPGAAT